MAVAATGNPRNAYDMGLLTAQELRSYGVDFDLAPVMDINCNPDNPVIGVRSYGDTPERVAEYGSQMVRGLLDGGVYCSLQAFPRPWRYGRWIPTLACPASTAALTS